MVPPRTRKTTEACHRGSRYTGQERGDRAERSPPAPIFLWETSCTAVPTPPDEGADRQARFSAPRPSRRQPPGARPRVRVTVVAVRAEDLPDRAVRAVPGARVGPVAAMAASVAARSPPAPSAGRRHEKSDRWSRDRATSTSARTAPISARTSFVRRDAGSIEGARSSVPFRPPASFGNSSIST